MKEKMNKNIIIFGLIIFLGFLSFVDMTFASDAFKMTEETFKSGVTEFSGKMKLFQTLLLAVGFLVAGWQIVMNPLRGIVIAISMIIMYFTASKMLYM